MFIERDIAHYDCFSSDVVDEVMFNISSTGHTSILFIQMGPCDHIKLFIRWSPDIPLEAKSAGFSANRTWCYLIVDRNPCISVTRFETNVFHLLAFTVYQLQCDYCGDHYVDWLKFYTYYQLS